VSAPLLIEYDVLLLAATSHAAGECGSVGNWPPTRPPRPREVFSRLHLRPPSPNGRDMGALRKLPGWGDGRFSKLDLILNFSATKCVHRIELGAVPIEEDSLVAV